MKIRVALATMAILGLVATPDGLAKPPTLLTVGSVDRHPTATWSLPFGVEATVAEVAKSPATSSDGYFFAENRVAFDILEATQTSWTDNSQLAPGTYYVHIGGLDRPCFFANQCPVREFSQIMTLVIAAPTPVPPPPATASLTVFKTGTGAGTVTSDPPGIDCGTDCSETYLAGIYVMLTATPAAGSVFAGWNNACGTSLRCQVTMSGSAFPTVRFDLAPVVNNPPPPPPTATPAAVDTTAPRVTALPSAGRPGFLVRLRFVVSDNKGRTRQQIVVYRGTKVLARIDRPMRASAAVESVSFRIPKTTRSGLRFCVVAWDPAGNASSKSCNRVTVI